MNPNPEALAADRIAHLGLAPDAHRLSREAMSAPTTTATRRCRVRVRVWYGDTAIGDCTAEADLAERYAAAMTRRLVDVRITKEPAAGQPATTARS